MTWSTLSGEVLAGSSCNTGLQQPLSVSQHSCWVGSRSELQTEKSGLYGAEGWDVMGWDWKGGAVAHWLPPVNIGTTIASALNPGLLLCPHFVTYLFWVLFHCLTSSTSRFLDYEKSQAFKLYSARQQVLCP